ncbi:MAG TPA: cephalosporin hydroxylase family protein [Polyangia bacterium]|nr:cephalosporin hydroxylase family protein [Polyangia bacterium]
MTPEEEFKAQREKALAEQGADKELLALSRKWMLDTARHGYTYNFRWMGRPIIQFPQDIVALQEVVWAVQPKVIVETGVAHGGSAVFFASMLELIGDPRARVIAVDIDIREHNRQAIEAHPMAKRIRLIQGSSVSDETVGKVIAQVGQDGPVLVVLDSNHTEEHVLDELRRYAKLVSVGSYIVVMDTSVEHAPKELFPNRPWGPGNSPLSAVRKFLTETDAFVVDEGYDHKLLISVAPEGFLKRVK